MKFSDTTSKDGIIQQIEFRTNIGDTGISGDATLLKQITGQINDYYMKATSIIIGADGKWAWDDTNHINQPTATADLVSGQADYQLMSNAPTASQDWLQIERINVKDSSGSWYTLYPKDRRDFNTPLAERITTSGQPSSFDFDGVSIFLDAEPSYSSTGGLEAVFNRAPIEFASTDTTKRPGFNTLFHEYLVLGPVYIWEKYKGVGNPEQTMRDIKEMEVAMGKFYGNRDQTQVNALRRASGSRLMR